MVVIFIKSYFHDEELKKFLPIFVSSFAITYLVHMVGFLDIILILILLGTLLYQGKYKYFGYCAGIIISLLVHEMYLIAFFPVLLFNIVFDQIRLGTLSRKNLIPLFGLMLLAVLFSLRLAALKPLTGELHLQLYSLYSAKADFNVREDAIEVLNRSFTDNIAEMTKHFFAFKWYLKHLGAMFGFLWVSVLFLTLSINRIQTHFQSRWLCWMAAIASLSPLLLNFLGYDLFRWYALSVFNSFIVYALTTKLPLKKPSLISDRITQTSIFALVAINLSTSVGLFDDVKINSFPYIDELKTILRNNDTYNHIR